MKVLHVNTERGWRGGERQTYLLAKQQALKGHDVWMAARSDGPLAARCAAEGIQVIPTAPLFEFDLWTAARLRRAVLDLSIDVVHAHTGHAVGLAALAVRGTPAKAVATRRVDFALKNNFLTRWKYARMDKVACISTRVREIVMDGGVPAEKTALIPSGIDPAGYPSAADRDRLRRERNIGLQDVVLSQVGALVPHKDQATLLKAVQRVVWEEPRLKVFILGDGPLRGELEGLARSLGIADRVHFLGHHPEVYQYTALADIFVFSSKEEGLGTALLDALVMGVPTAATNAGGIPDMYGGPGAPELSPRKDPAALARNILSVLTDPAEARRRVERGHARVQGFTAAAMAASYEALYADLLRS